MPTNQIESIQISRLNFPIEGLVAFAIVKYAGLILSNIGIYALKSGNGYRITYPTKKAKDHDCHVFNPYDKEVSAMLETAIIKEYKKLYE